MMSIATYDFSPIPEWASRLGVRAALFWFFHDREFFPFRRRGHAPTPVQVSPNGDDGANRWAVRIAQSKNIKPT